MFWSRTGTPLQIRLPSSSVQNTPGSTPGTPRTLTSQLSMPLSLDHCHLLVMVQYNYTSQRGAPTLWFWEVFRDPVQIYSRILPSPTHSRTCATVRHNPGASVTQFKKDRPFLSSVFPFLHENRIPCCLAGQWLLRINAPSPRLFCGCPVSRPWKYWVLLLVVPCRRSNVPCFTDGRNVGTPASSRTATLDREVGVVCGGATR